MTREEIRRMTREEMTERALKALKEIRYYETDTGATLSGSQDELLDAIYVLEKAIRELLDRVEELEGG